MSEKRPPNSIYFMKFTALLFNVYALYSEPQCLAI